MRHALSIIFISATLAFSLAATDAVFAAPPANSICTRWLLGQYLIRDTWGWHFQTVRLRCLEWRYVGKDVTFNRFFFTGDPAPWTTYGEYRALNPQPIPPGRWRWTDDRGWTLQR